MKRFISLLLALALVAAGACSNAPQPNRQTQRKTKLMLPQWKARARGTVEKILTTSWGHYDFDGCEFRIVTCNNMTDHYFMEESTGDVVNDAIYTRNSTVEERFNCKISVISDTGHRETGIIVNTATANEDAIDLVCWHVVVLGQIVPGGYFMNWYDIPKVDFTKPWWSDSNINDLTYNGVCIIAIGDFILSAIGKTYCVFYNKKLGAIMVFRTCMKSPAAATGLSTIWSAFQRIFTSMSITTMQSTTMTCTGLTSDCKSNVCAYLWAFDNPVFTKNNEGKMEFALNLEKTAVIVTKIMDAFSHIQRDSHGQKLYQH